MAYIGRTHIRLLSVEADGTISCDAASYCVLIRPVYFSGYFFVSRDFLSVLDFNTAPGVLC